MLHRRLFVVQTEMDGQMVVKQPTLFLDLVPLDKAKGEAKVAVPDASHLPRQDQVEQALIEQALSPFSQEIQAQRKKDVSTIREHLEISLNAIIDRVQCQFAELLSQKESGSQESGLDGRMKQTEDRLF